jgi:hypothetical protein
VRQPRTVWRKGRSSTWSELRVAFLLAWSMSMPTRRPFASKSRTIPGRTARESCACAKESAAAQRSCYSRRYAAAWRRVTLLRGVAGLFAFVSRLLAALLSAS